jgi:uncharacterized membrane protein YgcG
VLALLATTLPMPVVAAGPPFPPSSADQAVYDPAGAIEASTETALEERIDAIERESGAEIVVYLQLDPFVSEEENLEKARALMDEWGVGRAGFDDGLVILIGLREDLVHGRVSLFGGSGFTGAYLDEGEMSDVIADDFVPLAAAGDLDGALLQTLGAVDAAVDPGGRQRLESARQVNAVLGFVVAPVVLLGTLGTAWLTWRRRGRDPYFLDSDSILMAGPPAGMTPPLATVVTNGKATQHSLSTTLVELAASGRIAFRNLDAVRTVRSDSDPDPATDPAILVNGDVSTEPLAGPQRAAWEAIRRLAGGLTQLSRERLWELNTHLEPIGPMLEDEALRLGWFMHRPRLAIGRMVGFGILELVAGLAAVVLGFVLPANGLTLVGAALAIGGIGTVAFGSAMSQRSVEGSRVNGMLKAYRRTLAKTLEQARSMEQVVANPTVRILADTPDKAVVWGIALGLHDEVAAVLARSLEDQREAIGSARPAYYPVWLGTSSGDGFGAAGRSGTVSRGGGGLFSGSGMPNLAGMFVALNTIGSTPSSSSSSSGGGFSGGSSSGGGGSSGSF